MATPIPDSLERLSQSDLIGVVRDLIGEVGRLRAEKATPQLLELASERFEQHLYHARPPQ